MPYPQEPPWRAIAEKKRRAAERAEQRAAELRAQAAAIELEQRSRKAEAS